MEVTMKITGMMCPKCEARTKKALEAVPGVESAAVARDPGCAVVKGENLDLAALKAAVTDAGYTVVD